ncbi:hypothetical protein B1R94_12900 [Mycolicibacterium litorale]|nr:hypothetical protein B1R94_12900 [Mycolicibacterium litorale]
MATLPWTPTRTAAEVVAQGHEVADVVVMASRFDLRSYRDVPRFLLAALRIRRQMLAAPGCFGVSLIAKPLQKRFYTLSAWRNREALDGAVQRRPHVGTMTGFRSLMAASLFAAWTQPTTDLPPGWPEAIERLAPASAAGDG